MIKIEPRVAMVANWEGRGQLPPLAPTWLRHYIYIYMKIQWEMGFISIFYSHLIHQFFFIKKLKTSTFPMNIETSSTWGFSCCGQSFDLFCFCSGFDSLCACLSSPRCLTYSWACRMSSRPWGIVVVRVSWSEHPT